MSNLKQRLNEIKKIADDATPGPWQRLKDPSKIVRVYICDLQKNILAQVDYQYCDSVLFSESRTLIPALVEALEIAVEALEESCQYPNALKQIEEIMGVKKYTATKTIESGEGFNETETD